MVRKKNYAKNASDGRKFRTVDYSGRKRHNLRPFIFITLKNHNLENRLVVALP